jgi:DNA-binding response OmpR family regulator
VKILVVTGYSSPAQLQAARDAGADECLPKPFTGDELRRRVCALLNIQVPRQPPEPSAPSTGR